MLLFQNKQKTGQNYPVFIYKKPVLDDLKRSKMKK